VEIKLARQPYRFIKKAKQPLKTKIKKELEKISDNQKIGKQLSGRLKQIQDHKFTFTGVQYRIAYKVSKTTLIILIASRENFYRDLH